MKDYADAITLYQGDTSRPVNVGVDFLQDGETLELYWTCKTSVIDRRGNVIVDPRLETVLSDDKRSWIVYLSPTDTGLVDVPNLPVDVVWVIEVTNPATVPVYNREQHILVTVKKQGL